MISFFSAPGGGGASGGAAASPPKKSLLSAIKKPLIIGVPLLLSGLLLFYGYTYINEKLKQIYENRDQIAALQNTVKKLQDHIELTKKPKSGEIAESVKAEPVKAPETAAVSQRGNVSPPLFESGSVAEVWKEVRLLETELDIMKEKCCNEAESVKKEVDSFRNRLDLTQSVKVKAVKSPPERKPVTSERPDKKSESGIKKSLVSSKEDENSVTATICFNDPVRILSGQVLVAFSGLVPGPLASFDLTLPNSDTHYLRAMETGSRRPFECNQQGYFFDFMGIEGNCAKVEISKRLSF